MSTYDDHTLRIIDLVVGKCYSAAIQESYIYTKKPFYSDLSIFKTPINLGKCSWVDKPSVRCGFNDIPIDSGYGKKQDGFLSTDDSMGLRFYETSCPTAPEHNDPTALSFSSSAAAPPIEDEDPSRRRRGGRRRRTHRRNMRKRSTRRRR